MKMFTLKITYLLGLILIIPAISFSQTNTCNNTLGGMVAVGNSCNPTTMNTNTNNKYWTGFDGSCSSENRDDKWAWFTASSNNTVITYTSTNSELPIMHLFQGVGCNVNMVPVACVLATATATIIYATTPGTVYHVRIQADFSNATMNGSICVYNAPPAPPCGLNYSHSSIAYNNVNYTNGTSITFNDDEYAPSYTSIGFPFCFDGTTYNDVLISSNGYVTFSTIHSSNAEGFSVPSGDSPYEMVAGAAIPNTNQAPRNAILGVWQDIDPSASGTVKTRIHGSAPNRRFVIKFSNIAMYDCNAKKLNAQIMLYETTNNIDIHIGEKTVCAGWNGGDGILGLHDYSGANAVVPPGGYNYPTNWTVGTGSPEGHRFTSNCGACVVLPVELLDFTGVGRENENHMFWTTATEINNDYFVIEKSVEVGVFYEIGRVDGSGNSNINIDYKFIDKEITSGVAYYRLRQVDFDGKINYSKIVAIRSQDKTIIEMYPNPANDKFVVTGAALGDEIQMYDMVGNIVLEQKVTDVREAILLEDFPRGNYIVKILGNKTSVIEKLIIDH